MLVLWNNSNIYGSFLPFSPHRVFSVPKLDNALPCNEENNNKSVGESVSRESGNAFPLSLLIRHGRDRMHVPREEATLDLPHATKVIQGTVEDAKIIYVGLFLFPIVDVTEKPSSMFSVLMCSW